MDQITTQKVTQNEVEVTYNPDKIKKGQSVGNPTLRPDLKVLTDEQLIKYIGQHNVRSILEAKVNALANNCFNEASEKDTEGNVVDFSLSEWTDLIQGITIAGETLDELEEKLLAISAEQRDLISDPNVDLAVIKPRIIELRDEALKIESARNKRQEAAKARAAKRMATQAAKAATQPAPVQA